MYVPDWIREHSDHWKTQVGSDRQENETDAEVANRADAVFAALLVPVTTDVTTVQEMYKVYSYWCISLTFVVDHHWSSFVVPWFAVLTEAERRKTMDGCSWELNNTASMLDLVIMLDQPDLLRSVPFGEIMALPHVTGFATTENMSLHKVFVRGCAVKCLRAIGHGPFSPKDITAAVRWGGTKMLQYWSTASESKDQCGWIIQCSFSSLCGTAIACGHLSVIQWLFRQNTQNHKPIDFVYIFKKAIRHNSLPIFDWLHGISLEQNEWSETTGHECMLYAVERGYLPFVQRMREDWGYVWSTEEKWDVCVCAKNNDRFKVLRWVRANGAPWDQGRMDQEESIDYTIPIYASKQMREWIAAGGPRTEEDDETRLGTTGVQEKERIL